MFSSFRQIKSGLFFSPEGPYTNALVTVLLYVLNVFSLIRIRITDPNSDKNVRDILPLVIQLSVLHTVVDTLD